MRSADSQGYILLRASGLAWSPAGMKKPAFRQVRGLRQWGREASFRRVTCSWAENRRLPDLESGVDLRDCLLQVRGRTVTVSRLKFVAGFAQQSPGFGDLFVGLELSFVF